MNLLTLSISHRTAPIATLARVALDLHRQDLLLARLLTHPEVSEALVISTCNRTEVHLISGRFHAGLEAITHALGELTGITRDELSEICQVAWDEAAITHVFSLVAGLESLVLGEAQVLGQVRDALRRGQRRHAVGPHLNELFQHALRVGKRVQTETAIGHAGRSVLTAALDQAESLGIRLDHRRVLVIGAGQMAGLAARTMAARGAELILVNRTRARAEQLAAELGAQVGTMADLPALVATAEVVITCTGAAHKLIDPATITSTEHWPEVICDLALPADVDPAVAEHTTVINLATLAAASDRHEVEVDAARALVADEVAERLRLDRSRSVTPAVIALRARADQLVQAESARLARRQSFTPHQLSEINQALQRLAEKFLHAPSVEARQLAGSDTDTDYADMLRRLFRLDLEVVAPQPPEACDTRAALTVASPRLTDSLTDSGLTDRGLTEMEVPVDERMEA